MTTQRLTKKFLVLCESTPSLSSFAFLASFHAGVKPSIAVSDRSTPSLASIHNHVKARRGDFLLGHPFPVSAANEPGTGDGG